MGRLKCHTVTHLVFPHKMLKSEQVLSKFKAMCNVMLKYNMADDILFIFKPSISLNAWKCPVLLACHTVTMHFSQHIS